MIATDMMHYSYSVLLPFCVMRKIRIKVHFIVSIVGSVSLIRSPTFLPGEFVKEILIAILHAGRVATGQILCRTNGCKDRVILKYILNSK